MRIEETLRHNLLSLAYAYQRATGLKLSTISTYFAGDSRFFDSLGGKRPNGFSIRIYERAVEKFMQAWPEGFPIPETRDPPTLPGPYKRPKR